MSSRLTSAVGMIVLVAIASAAVVWVLRFDGRAKAQPPKGPAPAPASVTKAVKESDLNVITLTPEAEARLDLATAPIEQKKVRRVRLFGAEVVVPPGQTVVVCAPVAGTVRLPAGAAPLVPGQTLKQKQAVFDLFPLLAPEARANLTMSLVDAEGQVKNVQAQIKAAEVALARARQLAAEEAGSKRAVDEAEAQHDLAQKALEAAQARRDILSKTIQNAESGSIAAMSIQSPQPGVLRSVMVAPGQTVSSGAPLFEVVNIERVWVRVPVYVGEVGQMDRESSAWVGLLGAGAPAASIQTGRTAKPVKAPPSASALTSTVDLFYELDNAEAVLNPGQKVGATLALRSEEQSAVVPWSAVIFDVHGGAWVYENVAPHAYVRRRVQVLHVLDDLAVLASAPPAGTVVVIRGVAELFGKEMGFGK